MWVILNAFLRGRLPFDEDSVPALLKKIKQWQFSQHSNLHPPYRDLVAGILVVAWFPFRDKKDRLHNTTLNFLQPQDS